MRDTVLIFVVYVFGFITGVLVEDSNEIDLNIRLCQEQGYYEVYDKVIFCSVTTTEELIKRDLNGGE